MKVGPGDMLCHIAQLLASLRGNVNPRMEILFEKLSNQGWGCSITMPLRDVSSISSFEPVLPITTTSVTSPTSTILPIRQIEDISHQVKEEEDSVERNFFIASYS